MNRRVAPRPRALPSTVRYVLMISAVFGITSTSQADDWMDPSPCAYDSDDSAYRFMVIPWEYHPGGRRDDHPTRGVLLKNMGGDKWDTLWMREVLNPVSPVGAVVRNDGNYVITFDDWGGTGYGPNVVVIYGRGGQLVRRLALHDLVDTTAGDWLPASVSSIMWRARQPTFDVDDRLLLYVHKYAGSADWAQPVYDTVTVALTSGSLLSPKAGPGRFKFASCRSEDSAIVSDRISGKALLQRRDLSYASLTANNYSPPRLSWIHPTYGTGPGGDTIRLMRDYCVNAQETAWIAVVGLSTPNPKFGFRETHDLDVILWDDRMGDWGVVASEQNCRFGRIEWSPDGRYFSAESRGLEYDRLWVFQLVGAQRGYVKNVLTWQAPQGWEIFLHGTSPIYWRLGEGYIQVFTTKKEWHSDSDNQIVQLQLHAD